MSLCALEARARGERDFPETHTPGEDNIEETQKFTKPSSDSNRIYTAVKSKELNLAFPPGRIR